MLAIETDTKLATPISEEFTYEESDIFCRYAQRWYTALED
jgi:hypothetical protein